MMDPTTYQSQSKGLLEEIKEKYFPRTNKIVLKKGDHLLEEGEENHRLFLIKKGAVHGVIYRGGEAIELFVSDQDMFVGVYSFFSAISKSYTTVIATEDAELLYITREQLKEMNLDLVEFNEHFIPIIVNELHNRQQDAQKFYDQKEDALKQLMVQEKLAALGQLSAGLAHELNNAVAVLNQKVENFSEKLINALVNKGIEYKDLLIKASQGLGGHSTTELRSRKELIQRKLKHVSHSDAKKIATIASDDDLGDKKKLEALQKNIADLYEAWVLGRDLYDMRVASDHASHIVASVKTLAAPKKHTEEVNLSKTVTKALTLLQNQVKRLNVETDLDESILLSANEGDLVQVWVNLIKNAAESLLSSKTEDPTIAVSMKKKKDAVVVEVSDNGPGIPKDKQTHIFSPSFTTKVGGLTFGLGLGLSIVERLVNSYNGNIQLKSTSGNTVFKITLPKENHG